MSYVPHSTIEFGDSFNIDAFGRLRVSELTTQFDGKQLHDALPLFYDVEEIATGNAAHSKTNAESTLTTAASADAVICQTKQRFNYMTGKSALGMQTFRNFDHETNIEKRIGYWNSSTSTPFTSAFDGFYIESDGTNINFVISKGGTKNTIVQSTWNGDKMDGTGNSGIDLDLGTETGNLLFWWQFEWLGVGSVEFGFVYNGAFYTCHKEDHILTDGVYMETPNHSLRSEIRQTGAGSGTFRIICQTFNTEGAQNKIGKDGGIDDDGTHLTSSSTSNWYAAIGVKLSSAKADTLVDLLGGYLISDSNDKFLYRVLLNPTYASTITYNTVTDFSLKYGLGAAANTISAAGTILAVGSGESNSVQTFNLETAVKLGMSIDGTVDEIIIAVKPLSSNATIHRGINWKELS